MSLIAELKEDHRKIKALIEEIKSRSIASEEGRSLLGELKTLLVAHLAREDRELYPALKALEQSNAIASAFQTEMGSITAQALQIFERYEHGIKDKSQFARDTGQLFALVSGRIIKEEMRLYPAYTENVEFRI